MQGQASSRLWIVAYLSYNAASRLILDYQYNVYLSVPPLICVMMKQDIDKNLNLFL